MNQQEFEAILILLVPQVIALIMEHYHYDEITATRVFYESKVYSSLEEEETKVWHLSPLMLFTMFDEEQQTGTFEFPEEA